MFESMFHQGFNVQMLLSLSLLVVKNQSINKRKCVKFESMKSIFEMAGKDVIFACSAKSLQFSSKFRSSNSKILEGTEFRTKSVNDQDPSQ